MVLINYFLDIDYIEVCCDVKNRTRIQNRREFDYRVVMYSRNEQMDMKGRCSAGQKVIIKDRDKQL